MFCNRRWLNKLLAIALIFFGIGLLVATLLEWGWFMILLSLAFMILGLFLIFSDC